MTWYIFFQKCDFSGQTSLFHIKLHNLPVLFLINFGGLAFSKRKQFFKPDYLDQLKREEGGVHCNSF